jgi:UDP-N-acetylmuramoyl-L-alanyl-D-glutamate--2,6-diaminopimelate ligase
MPVARKLTQLLEELPACELIGRCDLEIDGIFYDSRRVVPASLFVAIPGFKRHGTEFLSEAVARGAVAVVTERPIEKMPHVTQIVVPDVREALALLSWSFAGHPEKRLRLCGVTGTNGKTSITHLLRAMLEAAGEKTGLIGTLTYEFGSQIQPALRTTPEAPDLADLFTGMTKDGATHCVMEVSSHALTLKRVKGLDFTVAAFSNIGRDHLDFHGTFENYRHAKALLFESLNPEATAVINIDDDFGKELGKFTRAKVLHCSLHEKADVQAMKVSLEPSEIHLDLRLPNRSWHLRSSLIGQFNASNVLIASACACALGLDEPEVQRGLDEVRGIPGRMEVVRGTHPFLVVVDFAHTPEALANVLDTLRALKPERILALFGAGGDRDRGKRPEMSRVVSEKADEVFLTSDNPRTESSEAILDDLEAGVIPGLPCCRNADRRAAIQMILQKARPKDCVLIAGKGAETTQEIQGVKYPFDDREVVRRVLSEMGYEV